MIWCKKKGEEREIYKKLKLKKYWLKLKIILLNFQILASLGWEDFCFLKVYQTTQYFVIGHPIPSQKKKTLLGKKIQK